MAGRELVSTILSVSLGQFPTAANNKSRGEIGLRLRVSPKQETRVEGWR